MIYSWTFLDKKNRGQLWYTIAFSVVIGMVIWGFFTKQYMMSFVVLLLTGLIFYVENNSEEQIDVEIGELGLKVSGNFYDYSKIKCFSLIYEGENAVFVRFYLLKKAIKILDLNIDNTVAMNLKEILPQFIEQNKKEDLSATDKIIRYLKL